MVDHFEYLWEFYFPSLLLFSLTYPRQYRLFNSFGMLGVLVFAPYVGHLIMIMSGDTLSAWALDQAGNPLAFLADPVRIAVSGPVRLIGPGMVSMTGGIAGFWLETTGAEGAASVEVASLRFDPVSVAFEVAG